MYPRLLYFSPPESSEPNWEISDLGYIIRESQDMLRHRTEDEIKAMLAFLNATLQAVFWEDFDELTIGQQLGEIRHSSGPADSLWSRTNSLDFSQSTAPADAEPCEYFAAMALALCGRCFEFDHSNEYREASRSSAAPARLYVDPESVMQATQALTTAKILRDSNPRTARLKTREAVKQHYRAAQQKAYAEKNAVYARFRKFYLENSVHFVTKKKAAGYFYENECSAEDRRRIISVSLNSPTGRDNAINNLLRRIRDLKKKSKA